MAIRVRSDGLDPVFACLLQGNTLLLLLARLHTLALLHVFLFFYLLLKCFLQEALTS